LGYTSRVLRYLPLAVGLVAAFVGPRLTAPQDRPAHAPFEYTPPAGFTETKPEGSVEKAWAYSELGATYRPNITLLTTNKTSKIDEPDLLTLARGMPAIFLQSQTAWTEARHETHVRPDGARVGVIVGDAEKGTLHYRTLQIVFPTDAGTAIVTASFPMADVGRWESATLASIDDAKGVAFHAPPAPSWMYVAWGVGGAVIAYLALALRKKS
jgi:hypothetical protein